MTSCFLFAALGFMSSFGFLRFGGNFYGQLDGFLEGVSCTRVHRFDGLNIDVGDDEFVLGEHETIADFTCLVDSKNSRTDEFSAVLVELVETVSGNGTSDSGCNSLAGVTDKVRNREDLVRILARRVGLKKTNYS